MKKIKLDYTEEYDFLLLGITAYEKDYRLIWSINNSLNLALAKTDDHEVLHKKSGEKQSYSCFSGHDENTMLDFKVIANKSENGLLMDELKNIDFFMVIKGEYDAHFSSSLKQKINKLENIQAVFVIDPEKLKNKERLISFE